jgi:hypothetical protein
MLKNGSVAQAERPLNGSGFGKNENWSGVLDAYGVQFLVLNLHSESDMVNFFRAQPGWKVDFEDEESIIFARADVTGLSAIL